MNDLERARQQQETRRRTFETEGLSRARSSLREQKRNNRYVIGTFVISLLALIVSLSGVHFALPRLLPAMTPALWAAGVIGAKLLFCLAANYVGGLLAREWVIYLRTKIDKNYKPAEERLPSVDWSLGSIERLTTMGLMILAPALVPVFIGGWTALKFAANWRVRMPTSEEPREQDKVARQRLTFLVGSAASLAVAIAAGIILNPGAIAAWTPK